MKEHLSFCNFVFSSVVSTLTSMVSMFIQSSCLTPCHPPCFFPSVACHFCDSFWVILAGFAKLLPRLALTLAHNLYCWHVALIHLHSIVGHEMTFSRIAL